MRMLTASEELNTQMVAKARLWLNANETVAAAEQNVERAERALADAQEALVKCAAVLGDVVGRNIQERMIKVNGDTLVHVQGRFPVDDDPVISIRAVALVEEPE